MTQRNLTLEGVSVLVKEATLRICSYVHHTPLLATPTLSEETSASIFLKLENEQVTGSFKVRGAFNKIGVLADKGVTKVYTASTGNHGLACALAFKTLGVGGQVFVPVTADDEKKKKLRAAGANLLEYGTDCAETETYARRLAEENGVKYLSPYNDYYVLAGQGTIGAEILQDLPDVDAIFVSVGGGGLIAGIASYVKTERPSCKIVGCSPANSKVMHESVKVGRIIQDESKETLSDGTAGGIEEFTVTFPLCRDLVDQWVLVEEHEIAEAVFYCLKNHKKVVEGAAGVALAAMKKVSANFKGLRVAVVICGANISMTNLKNIITTYA
ncbi:L-threonine dehydratase catabolic TdcB-like [Homarus americanus]|uniref:L-threonine dehydratase catabolic TdcB-like n=1 Tax=Homarus americanus TaxID=6706 RepID=UPI001C474115|nr:L-threonine dehydratase catabolic TdcB-like [Homarus americanus]